MYKDTDMSTKLKIEVLEACTIPTLTYGTQTWSLTKTQTERLKITQRAMERSILGVKKKERTSNKTLRRKTKTTNIGHKIKKLKFKYAGHLAKFQVVSVVMSFNVMYTG